MYPVLFRSFPDDSTIATQDTVASRLRERMAFEKADREAKVVNVKFQSSSPVAAANIVGITMTEYTNLSTRQNRAGARSAVAFLRNEQERIVKQLRESEEELRGFMNRTNLIEVDAQTEKIISQLAEMEGKRQEARSKLQAANSGIERYESQLNNIKPGLAEQYSNAVGPKLTRLQYQLAELEIEKLRLLARNPQLREASNPPESLQKINDQVSVYKQRVNELVAQVLNKNPKYVNFLSGTGVSETITQLNQKLLELQVQQSQYQSQVDILTTQINQREQFFNSLPDNIIDLARLQRDVKINETLYTAVSEQYAQTALWEQTQFGLGTIIDGAFVAKKPIKPDKKLYVFLGFLIGGFFSVGYVLMKDAFDTTIDGVEIMKSNEEPLLAVVPGLSDHIDKHHDGDEKTTVQGHTISTGLITILDNISPIAESYRRLANNLIYSNPDTRMKSIMITSAGKREGKTTTISNLGVVLAEAGYKTVIVDTDLRRPNLHNMFGLSKKPGFVDVLFDDVELQDAIKDTISPGLSILPAGRKPPSPATITQSRAFLNTVKELEKEYDIVLIDTPPFGIISDASAIITQTNGVVVVARFNETTEVQLEHTLEHLQKLKAPIFGTVLAAFDHSKSNDYYYSSAYYNSIYKDYDEYEEEGSST